jgi:hypothetical protein
MMMKGAHQKNLFSKAPDKHNLDDYRKDLQPHNEPKGKNKQKHAPGGAD